MLYTTAPWYAAIGNASHITFGKTDKKVRIADTYAEVSFDEGYVLDDTATMKLNISIAKNDWSNFDQSNDYSYNNASKVVVYYDGKVISGKEL